MKRLNITYLFCVLITCFTIIINSIFYNQNSNKDLPISNIVTNKTIYLTFDDGPSENTIKILDILDRYEIQATFFVVGPSYKLKDDLLLEILNRGHTIAIHSYEHEYSKIYKNEEEYLKDFYKCKEWITKITGITPTLYRFPGGSSTTIANRKLIESIIVSLEKEKYYHVDWNVDSFDSHYNEDYNAIVNSTINFIKTNETNKTYNQIILMHDNTKKIATLHALPSIIEFCLSKGYVFKTLNNHTKLIQHVKRPN